MSAFLLSGDTARVGIDARDGKGKASRKEWIRRTCIDPGLVTADADRGQKVEREKQDGDKALEAGKQIEKRHVISSRTVQQLSMALVKQPFVPDS